MLGGWCFGLEPNGDDGNAEIKTLSVVPPIAVLFMFMFNYATWNQVTRTQI